MDAASRGEIRVGVMTGLQGLDIVPVPFDEAPTESPS
jgi:hypothetical protein